MAGEASAGSSVAEQCPDATEHVEVRVADTHLDAARLAERVVDRLFDHVVDHLHLSAATAARAADQGERAARRATPARLAIAVGDEHALGPTLAERTQDGGQTGHAATAAGDCGPQPIDQFGLARSFDLALDLDG